MYKFVIERAGTSALDGAYIVQVDDYESRRIGFITSAADAARIVDALNEAKVAQ